MSKPLQHFFLTCLGVAAICIARRPHRIFNPDFPAEDGAVFLQNAWNLPFYKAIFAPYADYFHALPNALTELSVNLVPIAAAPTLLLSLNLTFTAIALSWFSLPNFRHLMPSDKGRQLTALALAALPSADNLTLALGLHWYATFWLILICCMHIPKHRAFWPACAPVAFLSIFSAPLTVLLLPLFVFNALRTHVKRDRFAFAALAVTTLTMLVLARLNSHPSSIDFGYALSDFLRAFANLHAVSFIASTLLGESAAFALAKLGWFPFLYALALSTAAAVVFAAIRLPALRWYILLFSAIAIASGSLALLRAQWMKDFVTGTNALFHQRYLTIPSLLFVLSCALTLAALANHLPTRLRANPYLRYTAALAFCALLPFGVLRSPIWPFTEVFWPQNAAHIQRMLDRTNLGRPAPDVLITGHHSIIRLQSPIPWNPAPPPATPDAFFCDLQPAPNGNFFVPWFGFVSPKSWPNIQHPTLGTLTATSVADGRFHFSRPDGRSAYSNPGLFPKLIEHWFGDDGRQYSYDAQGRLWTMAPSGTWFTQTNDGMFWFINADGDWQFSDSEPN